MPTVPTAITATAATATLAKVLMAGNLHGTREARRCGIEGNAARTVPSTAAGAMVGIGLEPVRDAGLEVGIDRGFGSCRSLLGRREGAPVMVERGPQLTDRVVESGPRGPFGNAQGLRDLRERIPKVVVQDDDRPLLRCQPAEGAFELVPRGDGARHVRFERCVDSE